MAIASPKLRPNLKEGMVWLKEGLADARPSTAPAPLRCADMRWVVQRLVCTVPLGTTAALQESTMFHALDRLDPVHSSVLPPRLLAAGFRTGLVALAAALALAGCNDDGDALSMQRPLRSRSISEVLAYGPTAEKAVHAHAQQPNPAPFRAFRRASTS